MRFKTLTLVSLIALNSLMSQAIAQDYDLVINNGRVIDPETMFDAVTNVGVRDGRIAAITTEKLSGKRTINAKGLVVSPGFIDTHFHAVDPFATKMALRDGTTTGMDLELGSTRVAEWYAEKERAGWQVNFGTTASHNLVRMLVHDPEVSIIEPIDYSNAPGYLNETAADGVQGWSVTRSSLEQMNEILKILDEDLREGALGIGVGAAYMARGMTSYEQFSVQRAAARYGRLTSVHTRYHLGSETPTEAPIALAEVLVNAMLLDAPLLLAHDNDYGWWENEEKLKMARAKGYNVWAEYYPYDAGSTPVSADFLRPEIWKDTYGNKYEDTIYDPTGDRFLTDETYAELVKSNPGQPIVVFLRARTEWMPYWLRIPHMTVATDAMGGVGTDGELLPWDAPYEAYVGHPRTAGANAKVLRLAREQGVPLMFTLAQLSYWSALHLGDAGIEDMQERGRVQVGKIADLTLFDPDKVTDNATYKAGESGLPSTGFPYVIINGTVVVEKDTVLPVKPGQPIRYPVEDEGRHVDVDVNEWLSAFTINAGSVPLDDTGAGKELESPSSENTQ